MGRPTAKQPSYYASRGAYYCWFNGKQILCAVGPEGDKATLEAALRVWWDLQGPKHGGAPTDEMSVISVLDCYVAHIRKTGATKTYKNRKYYAQSFINWAGAHVAKTLTVAMLTPALVNEWCDAQEAPRPHPVGKKRLVSWGPGSRRAGLSMVRAALRHAVLMGFVKTDPLARLKLPRPTARTGASVISDEQHAALLAFIGPNDPFAALLVALHATGARPGELAGLTAAHVHQEDGVTFLDLTKWKTDKTAAFRHLFLSEQLEQLVLGLVVRHPTGPLFRNERGVAWKQGAVCKRFSKARRKLGMPETISAYSYRHAFATSWLLAGRSIKLLADLLGNTVATLEKHYAHLMRDKGAMQAALRTFRA